MIKVVTPEKTYFPHKGDEDWFNDEYAIKVFLAGTIDNGKSIDWQYSLISNILIYNLKENDDTDFDEDFSLKDLIIYNPRVTNWNPNPTNEDIEKQILWEQEHLEDSDIIIMNILPDSKSPISLLELGLYGPEGKMIVFCSEDFYRFTNIKLTCERYNIPLVKSNNLTEICSQLITTYNDLKNI